MFATDLNHDNMKVVEEVVNFFRQNLDSANYCGTIIMRKISI